MKHKTKIERVYNEDTGWFEAREYRKSNSGLGAVKLHAIYRFHATKGKK